MTVNDTNEGDPCNKEGCEGHFYSPEVEGCTCHISPPCGACVNNALICDDCGEEA